MKKILLGLACVLIYIMPANAITKSIGITAVSSTIDSTVTDDVDSNGTIDTTKDISNDIGYGSLFFEVSGSNHIGKLLVFLTCCSLGKHTHY